MLYNSVPHSHGHEHDIWKIIILLNQEVFHFHAGEKQGSLRRRLPFRFNPQGNAMTWRLFPACTGWWVRWEFHHANPQQPRNRPGVSPLGMVDPCCMIKTSTGKMISGTWASGCINWWGYLKTLNGETNNFGYHDLRKHPTLMILLLLLLLLLVLLWYLAIVPIIRPLRPCQVCARQNHARVLVATGERGIWRASQGAQGGTPRG